MNGNSFSVPFDSHDSFTLSAFYVTNKSNMKKNVFLILLLPVLLAGQTIPYELPEIVPASPTAQTFMRYGEIPVNYSTGVPNIDIPIYTVKGKKLSVPISISYHASGIKVNDVASEVGLGWALNAGGMVSRSINDKRDELNNSYRAYNNSQDLLTAVAQDAPILYSNCQCYTNIIGFEQLFDTGLNGQDLMSDRYYYVLPSGVSGGFTYDYQYVNETDASIITMPYRPYKIERILGYNSYYNENIIEGFKITDDDGTVYIFDFYLSSAKRTRTEWLLKQIISADGTDIITFNYTQPIDHIPTPTIASHVLIGPDEDVEGLSNTGLCVTSEPLAIESTLSTNYAPVADYGTPLLESIISSREIIQFEYDDRDDFDILKKLTQITVSRTDAPSEIIRTIQLDHSYFGTSAADKRLKLNDVVFSVPGTSSDQNQQYTFTYENQILPPYWFKSQSEGFNQDFWGYNNGSQSPNLIHDAFTRDGENINCGNRESDNGTLAKACMLKEIEYPTGGRTAFEFERAYVSLLYRYKTGNQSQAGYVGGFRVKSITNYDENNTVANIKSYEYNDPSYHPVYEEYYIYDQLHTDYRSYLPDDLNEGGFVFCWLNYTNYMVLSEPVLPLEIAPGLPVAYREIVEYNGTQSNNQGKTVYQYYVPDPPTNYIEQFRYYHPNHFDRGNYTPELLSKKVYSYDNNGNAYRPLTEEKYEYSTFYTQEFTTGINLTRTQTFHDIPQPVDYQGLFSADYVQSIKAMDTKAYQEASLMTNSKIFTYDPQDDTKYVLTSTDYLYNEENLQVKEKTTVSSTGDVLKSTYKYPHDFATTEPYETMLEENILTPMVEQREYNGTDQISKINNSYKDWGNNIIAPDSVMVKKGTSGTVEDRLEYLSYDNYGNLTSVKQSDGTPIAYLWGYNHALPIAKVENARFVTGNVSQSWSQSFGLTADMYMGQQYVLNGTWTITQAVNASIDRQYYNFNQQASFTIWVYDENHTLMATFTDNPTTNDLLNGTWFPGTISLPAGEYTVEATVIYPYGTTHNDNEINVTLSASVAVGASLPFYTSFEEDTDQLSTAYFKTGKKCHTGLYTLQVPPSSLGYGQVIISYWGKTNASAPWTYVEQTVNTTTAGFNSTIGSGYAYIDEVRMYPVDARMYTYTYDPAIGVTDITDFETDTMYYEYDEFGRLKYIRDKDNNILSKTEYNFAH